MTGLEELLSLISDGLAFMRYHLPPDLLPSSVTASMVAVVAGLMLALWGARLLKLSYVLGFMALGGYAGVHLARTFQVDVLIGLVLGGGLVGLLGYVLYRWWVALTACALAMLVVGTLGGAQVLPAEIDAYLQHASGSPGEAYVLPEPGGMEPQGWSAVTAALASMRDYFWADRRGLVLRSGAVLGLAGLLGLALGIVFPRLTSIVVTSFIGLGMVVIGLGALISSRRPELWEAMSTHGNWLVAGAGLALVTSLAVQAWQGKPRVPTMISPAPA